ncbi:hypothetical protein [Crocosphaera sp.]|uniref:hypothetical protein n=1 Tax=Crocosphaera sp. TaxID=2729996 RepID=UPI0026032175|nr:hypothetical protein [Crocosphaera sp.]MDJ0581741.1 hypothetical protein [Crocosphaera sp.]
METVNFSISEILEIYNTIPGILYNKVIKVNLESEQSSSKEKLFKEVTNGSYWIVKTEDGKEWLLPSNKLKLNQYNEKSIQSFFEFQSYDSSENKDFVLVQPATVILVPNATRKEWKLEKLGTLNFDPKYSTNKLRSQLKKIENERDQYKSELEEIKQEKEQLTTQVAELASDSLQDIRDSLVTKDELNNQIKKLTEQLTQSSLNSSKDNQLGSVSNTEFKELQKSQIKNTKRIYILEQSIEKDKQIKEYLKELHRKQDNTIDFINELEKKIRESEEKIATSESQLATLKEEQFQLLILKERLQNCENKLSQTQGQLNMLPDLLIRLEKLERYLKAKEEVTSSSNTPKYSSSRQEDIVKETQTITFSERKLSLEEYKLVERYNEERESLDNADQVSETEPSSSDRRLGKSTIVILEKKRRGNFSIVEQEGITYLIPSNNLRINEFNVKTVEIVFECQGYQPNLSSGFKLLQPAIVTETNDGKNWQLQQLGILQF